MGWICYGLVHLLIAGLALQIAFGDPGERAEPQGAIAKIAAQPWGAVALGVLAVGLVGFAVSQLVQAVTGFHWVRDRPTRWVRRLGAAGRAVVGVAIGVLAASKAMGGPVPEGGTQQKGITERLLAFPAGSVLVGLVACGVLVVAVATVRRGVLRSFEEDLEMDELPKGTRPWIEWLGIIGWIAKGVSFAGIGGLFAAAALYADARRSGGLDQALHLLAAFPLGQAALVAVAAGFAAFGAFCLAAAKTHRA